MLLLLILAFAQENIEVSNSRPYVIFVDIINHYMQIHMRFCVLMTWCQMIHVARFWWCGWIDYMCSELACKYANWARSTMRLWTPFAKPIMPDNFCAPCPHTKTHAKFRDYAMHHLTLTFHDTSDPILFVQIMRWVVVLFHIISQKFTNYPDLW